ncbi:hypothetical protein BpHYR1_029089 [Brachionus plicatilis]|uniref:Uncharacterized protein n=1 Tax=Brachionus plicatilis TaxID=10195 RepID=A0A3M7Q466_BRAPC|nr:hypothetical protein BpHYR1_029089 [Brachionus plicatilis]
MGTSSSIGSLALSPDDVELVSSVMVMIWRLMCQLYTIYIGLSAALVLVLNERADPIKITGVKFSLRGDMCKVFKY